MTDAGDTYTYTFDDITSANDAKITSLKIVPAEDYFSTEASPLNLKVSAIVTDGTVVGSPVEQTIPVVIEERADPIEISFENFTNEPDDSENLSVQRNTTNSSNLSLSSYEKIANDTGITIVKTDSSGNYDILNKSLDGSNLQNTDIQSLRFEISGILKIQLNHL